MATVRRQIDWTVDVMSMSYRITQVLDQRADSSSALNGGPVASDTQPTSGSERRRRSGG
jgi:hypothetical protein